MDDFLILDFNKRELHKIKREIGEFLGDKLKLELHPRKANIFPVGKGIDFLGYQIFGNYKLLRKSFIESKKKYIAFYKPD